MKKTSEKNSFHNLFSDEEIKELQISEDELAMIEHAQAAVDTINILPENSSALIEKIQKLFGNEPTQEEIEAKVKELSKSDPEFLKQLISLYSLVQFSGVEEEEQPKVEKVEINKIKEEKEKETKAHDDAVWNSILQTVKSFK